LQQCGEIRVRASDELIEIRNETVFSGDDIITIVIRRKLFNAFVVRFAQSGQQANEQRFHLVEVAAADLVGASLSRNEVDHGLEMLSNGMAGNVASGRNLGELFEGWNQSVDLLIAIEGFAAPFPAEITPFNQGLAGVSQLIQGLLVLI
jgi:hypothetical protein